MPEPFLLRALLAGLGLAVAAGPLGCLMLWRRMAFFGDATAHAAILGIAVAFALSLPLPVGITGTALAMAGALTVLSGRGHAADAVLAVLSHSALAVGLVAVSFMPAMRSDLSAFLFGDILTVGTSDLAWIWAAALSVLAVLGWRWQRLLTATVNDELAQASGLDPRRERLVLTLTLALVVALSVKIVGALLIAAMLVVPAAAARGVSRTPETMALAAIAIGAVSVLAGLGVSLSLDTPAGPSIVTAAAAIFVVGQALARNRR